VANPLRYFDEKRDRLSAWCVMPNHVHVVALLFPGQTLATVAHSWKSFSAKQANRMLRRHGLFGKGSNMTTSFEASRSSNRRFAM
jgi:REP element-mobilizing transposase RayT